MICLRISREVSAPSLSSSRPSRAWALPTVAVPVSAKVDCIDRDDDVVSGPFRYLVTAVGTEIRLCGLKRLDETNLCKDAGRWVDVLSRSSNPFWHLTKDKGRTCWMGTSLV